MVWITTSVALTTFRALVTLLATGRTGVVLRVGGRLVTRLVLVLTVSQPAFVTMHTHSCRSL